MLRGSYGSSRITRDRRLLRVRSFLSAFHFAARSILQAVRYDTDAEILASRSMARLQIQRNGLIGAEPEGQSRQCPADSRIVGQARSCPSAARPTERQEMADKEPDKLSIGSAPRVAMRSARRSALRVLTTSTTTTPHPNRRWSAHFTAKASLARGRSFVPRDGELDQRGQSWVAVVGKNLLADIIDARPFDGHLQTGFGRHPSLNAAHFRCRTFAIKLPQGRHVDLDRPVAVEKWNGVKAGR